MNDVSGPFAETAEVSNANEGEKVSAETLSQAMSDKSAAEVQSGEAPAEESVVPKVEKPNDQFASKFAALSKREKALRQREVEIEQRLKQLEERSKPVEPKKEEFSELEYRKNPNKLLEKYGWDVKKLMEYELSDGKSLPLDQQMELMKQELEAKYNKELSDLKSSIDEDKKNRENEKYNQVIESFLGEITNHVTKNEQYELIRAQDAVGLVYEVIEQHHQETGRILDIDEAAQHVEQYLEDQYRTIFEKTKKFGAKAQPSAPSEGQSPRKVSSPTLSNAMNGQSSSANGERKLSEQELRAKAAQMIKWIE